MCGDKFDVRKSFRVFKRFQELELSFITGSADDKFHLDAALILLRFDADDADASRKNLLQIHEHERPVETARIDKAVDVGSAVMQIAIHIEIEKLLERRTLLLKLGHLLEDLCGFSAHFCIGFARQVDMPAEGQEND